MRYQIWERNERRGKDQPTGVECDHPGKARDVATWMGDRHRRSPDSGWEAYVVDTATPPVVAATVHGDQHLVLVGTVPAPTDEDPGRREYRIIGHWTPDWAAQGLEAAQRRWTGPGLYGDVHLARETNTYERLR